MLSKDEITHQTNRIFPILHYLHDNGEFENVINDIKNKLETMATDKEKLNPLLELLEGIVIANLPKLIELGEGAISGLFHKHAGEIVTVVKTLDIHPCPPGQTWNGTKCVDDFPTKTP